MFTVPPGKTKLVVPTQETLIAAMTALMADIQICLRMTMLCTEAVELLLSQMAHSFFLPFTLAAASVCSNLRICASNHLMHCTNIYNTFIPVAAALPQRKAGESEDSPCLPEALGVNWVGGLPRMVCHTFSSSDGFHQLGANTSAQHDVAYGAGSFSVSIEGATLRKNGSPCFLTFSRILHKFIVLIYGELK